MRFNPSVSLPRLKISGNVALRFLFNNIWPSLEWGNRNCDQGVRKITIFDKNETMQTVRLRINDKIYDKLIWLLSKFSKDEVEIIPESEDFIRNQKYLAGELNEIVSGKANFIELNEAETRLENPIIEPVYVKISPATTRGKYLIGLLRDLSKAGNDIEFDDIPNDETIQSIRRARAKKGYKAKDVKDLFKQLEA
jgi:hypothetical protein